MLVLRIYLSYMSLFGGECFSPLSVRGPRSVPSRIFERFVVKREHFSNSASDSPPPFLEDEVSLQLYPSLLLSQEEDFFFFGLRLALRGFLFYRVLLIIRSFFPIFSCFERGPTTVPSFRFPLRRGFLLPFLSYPPPVKA